MVVLMWLLMVGCGGEKVSGVTVIVKPKPTLQKYWRCGDELLIIASSRKALIVNAEDPTYLINGEAYFYEMIDNVVTFKKDDESFSMLMDDDVIIKGEKVFIKENPISSERFVGTSWYSSLKKTYLDFTTDMNLEYDNRIMKTSRITISYEYYIFEGDLMLINTSGYLECELRKFEFEENGDMRLGDYIYRVNE